MKAKPLTILVSAYACGPNWGSEVGMGWNWVIHLSNYCQLYVITESEFKKDIEEKIDTLKLNYKPHFYYINIGDKGRTLFWKQGSFSFYKHYRKWQKEALSLSKEIIANTPIDIVHQLNMIGYREPGYLWKLEGLPYVLGPVGGYNQFPIRFFSVLNLRDKLFFLARNIINSFQMYFLSRPKKAYKRANYVIIATPSGKSIISKYTRRAPILMPETGAYNISKNEVRVTAKNKKLVITWVGLIKGGKALPIALKSIAKSNYRDQITLNIIGDGPNLNKCKSLAQKLKLEDVNWFGKVPNAKAKDMIASSDLLFFTSVLDATSTVIFEALQTQTPVLCHDTCGFGAVINENCGIKIPLQNPKMSIALFSAKIDYLAQNPEVIEQMKKGCDLVLKDHYWEEKAKKMNDIYQQCLVD